ncbi:hypothetical protein ACKVMT_07605 [Halobacteriales archaeon Cl-PHB]
MSPPSLRRPLSLVLVVGCLALATVATLGLAGGVLADGDTQTETAGPTDQTQVVALENTSNHLVPAPGQSNRQSVGHTGVDVAAAVAISSEQLHSHHDRLAFDRALAGATTQEDRIAVVEAELDAIEREIGQLRGSQREVLGAYTNGSVSTATLLRDLARLDAAADGTQARLQRVRTTIEQVGVPTDLQTRRYNVRSDLLGLGGPASTRISNAMAGRGPATDAYVAVMGSRGLVVSTVENGWLYREAYDGSQLGSGGPDHFAERGSPVSVAYQRASTLYPWTFNHTIGSTYRGGFGSSPLYYVRPEHTHGDLSIYLDGRTESVFYEVQQKRAAAIPLADTVRNTNGTLAITANTTLGSGPLGVTVERTDTGNLADATITIDGTYVGKTGPDGELQTVQPDAPFTVTATTDNGESVEVRVAGG